MPAKTSTRRVSGRQESIVITQVVSTVPLSDDGTENPILAAFRACGEYFVDTLTPGRSVDLEFTFEGLEFSASYKATEQRELDLERMD